MNAVEAQTFLEDNFAPWVKALLPQVVEIGADGAALDIPITADIARVGGIVSGQALASLADTAMVFACIGHMGEAVPVATTNLETRFLTAGKGDSIRCTAKVIRGGRSLLFAQAELVSKPNDKLVAVASATFFKP